MRGLAQVKDPGQGKGHAAELTNCLTLQHCRIFRTAHFSHHPRSKAINMSANCATWTSERIELLKRCLYAGLSCGQTAREIGVTRNAVIGKMNRQWAYHGPRM